MKRRNPDPGVASGGTSLLRSLIRAAGLGAVAVLGAGYIRLVASTTRWTVIGREGWEELVATPGVFVCVAWHGRLFMAPTFAPGGRCVVTVSASQ